MTNIIDGIRSLTVPMVVLGMWCLLPVYAIAVTGDEATHEADHALDAEIIELPEVHVHGLPLNKDQQVGPVPKSTPWPAIPSSLEGKPLDDWMKARLLVSKEAQVTVVVLESAKHRELTIAGIIALNKWTFAPQLKGDDPVDGELTVRIHFRSQ
ncbi:MAG TPA: energy transducer TonB [Nitrospira sp.]|nr:energy transducer TonB [Nitrospira sp.]MBX3370384.1 energy transducer TonB [Nitrospira sp.]MBX7040088.1 energy transducer TonB [Nitrospira sp.]MCW5795727.1 energy transducer TonB [Nitrospira sp.]HMU30603.1 energy transducer TonB [Nitrospira sp.]